MSSKTKRNDGLVSQRKFMLKHNIASVSGDRVDAVSVLPNRGDRALSFFIPKTSNRLVNLSNIALHLKVRLVAGLEGKPIDPEHKYFIPGYAPSTIFGSVVIRVNDTEITNVGQHPLMSKFLFLTRLEPERRELLSEVNGFSGQWDEENLSSKTEEVTDDEAPSEEEEEEEEETATQGEPSGKKKKQKKTKKVKVWSVSSGRFPGAGSRSRQFTRDGGRGTATYSTFLMTELSGGTEKDLILPPCDLAIDFVPADPSRCILTTAPTLDTRVEIMAAHLTVPRILPKEDKILSLRWNYLRTKIIPLIVPKDRMEHHAVVLYSGLIGRRISLYMLGADNWEGTYRNSIYRSHHNDVESVELRLGSRVIPTNRIRANFDARENNELYMYVRESLKHSLRRTGAQDMIAKNSWETGGFLWSGDTTVDQSADAGFRSAPQTGSVNLTINFSKKTPRQLVLAVILESTGELRVDKEGTVTLKE